MKSIRVLAVDDSALMRNMLSAVVNQQPDMEMVGTAPDAFIARALLAHGDPGEHRSGVGGMLRQLRASGDADLLHHLLAPARKPP